MFTFCTSGNRTAIYSNEIGQKQKLKIRRQRKEWQYRQHDTHYAVMIIFAASFCWSWNLLQGASTIYGIIQQLVVNKGGIKRIKMNQR